ncbi:MAG: hypothetical protein QME48_08725 [bacterium]|nr:MAG: hypothetical protein XD76_1263 [candidate division TA06 bacterium 32_111]KUK86984.1 MAG: hypothetical protein XE03_1073 [candidate division TA06 bacterium 34_109]MDI6701290.1 hypothetical protein [bacterium]
MKKKKKNVTLSSTVPKITVIPALFDERNPERRSLTEAFFKEKCPPVLLKQRKNFGGPGDIKRYQS